MTHNGKGALASGIKRRWNAVGVIFRTPVTGLFAAEEFLDIYRISGAGDIQPKNKKETQETYSEWIATVQIILAKTSGGSFSASHQRRTGSIFRRISLFFSP